MHTKRLSSDNPNRMYYIPWKGPSYKEGYRHGLRLIILGDSFNKDTWSQTAPSEVVQKYVAGEHLRFFAKVQWVVTGTQARSEEERRAFWDRVAFTNLIQESMETPSTPPTEEQWRYAWECFPEIVSTTRPDVIFCFTRRGWNIQAKFDSPFIGSNIEQISSAQRPKDPAYLYDFSSVQPGYRAIAGCFNHPSSIASNQLGEWHQWAARLLNEAPAALKKDTQ
jgi:hypothetical protein